MRVLGKYLAVFLRATVIGIEGVLAAVSLYMVIALCGMAVQVGNDYQPEKGKESVEMYIRTDGIHTDFLLPVHTPYHQWGRTFPYRDVAGKDTTWFTHISVGWGDQGFFLETPTWADLTVQTAFDALFYRGKSALHICYQQQPEENFVCKKLVIGAAAYQRLVSYILRTADVVPTQAAIAIPEAGYYEYDAFYQARGKYSLFSTCNSWINAGLKQANLPACGWTPLSFAIFAKYE